MKHLSVVVPGGQSSLSTAACIIGTCEIFSAANDYWKQMGGEPVFQIELVGESRDTTYHHGMLTMHANKSISSVKSTDVIVIPSLARNFQRVVEDNVQLVEWIEEQYKDGAEVACMCTGSFLLAASGMLDGMKCATHWTAVDTFRHSFPNVHIQAEQLITDEKGIYTNGGAYSFLNLVVYLIEKYFDRETAIHCAKVFQIEYDRNSQSPFAIFTGQKLHGDDIIMKAQEYIENNMESKISIEDLASMFSLSRRNFDRRFMKATGNSPSEYIQRTRVEAAKRSLESTRKTINEVMYDVGYTDVKAFRSVFRKITGLSPAAYKEKYSLDSVFA